MEKLIHHVYHLLKQAEEQFEDDPDVISYDQSEALQIVKMAIELKIVNLLEDLANG